MPFVSVIAASVSAFPSLSRVVDHDNDQNQKSDTVQAKQNIEKCGEKRNFLGFFRCWNICAVGFF